MKIIVEFDLTRTDGTAASQGDIAAAIEDDLGGTIYADNEDGETETEYAVNSVTVVSGDG